MLAKLRLRGIDVPDDIPEFEEPTPVDGLRRKAAFRYEITKSAATHNLISVLFMDLDNFKLANDNYGYDAGDQVILEALQISAEIVGDSGELFRAHSDGDEMIVLLPGIGNSDAATIAETISLAIQEHNFSYLGQGIITISVGLATFPETCSSWQDLENVAEQLMKQAKREKKGAI
ncbi:MAG: GGDEF domain-containing protein [Pyrinomonadaceae bacterium]